MGTAPRLRDRAAAQSVLPCALALLLLSAAATAAPSDRPTDAVAFISVAVDLRMDLTEDWEGPWVREDVDYGTGSGFVISSSGLVLTNHHVVSGWTVRGKIKDVEVELGVDVRRIEVAVGGAGAHGRYEAWVVASDPDLDLAVLQVTASDLPSLRLGNSDAVGIGQPLRVVGYPFGREVEVGRARAPDVLPDPTVTSGSLSAARVDEGGRRRYLQTDASINPGSSGGPILDAEGYVVGVVAMKLTAEGQAEGAGFGVPIELVKDFLESHGLLDQVPGTRLRAGVVHTFDWKGIAVELPDGFADRSETRLVVDTAEPGAPVALRIERVSTSLDASALEQALLDARSVPGFVPGAAKNGRREQGDEPSRLLGSARGKGKRDAPFAVEYAILDLGPEKLAARYLGSPHEIAYNLGLIRRSLETLQAAPLQRESPGSPPAFRLEAVSLTGQTGLEVPMPAGWLREPLDHSPCAGMPGPAAGFVARTPDDFTVLFRVASWPGLDVPALAKACAAGPGTVGPTYSRGEMRLGVPVTRWGVVVEKGGTVLLLELEAPEAKIGLFKSAYVDWVRGVAAGS